MKFTPWVTFAHLIARVGFFITSFSTTLFSILTIFFVKEKVGSYRYLLLLLPLSGFFFASCEYLIDPFFHSYNQGFVLFRLSTFESFSLAFNTFLLAFYVALYGCTISVLSLQFAYRYWAVFRPRYIKKFFDGPRFIFPILYMLSGGSCWFLACFAFNQPDKYSFEYLGPDVYESHGVILSEQPLLVVVAYDRDGSVRISNTFGLFLMASFLSFQYSIIIYCAVLMGLKMHEKISILSSKLQQIHRQFYHALVLQITTPTITLFFPVFTLYFVPYLNIDISFPTGTCLSAFALYPGMDVFIMLYIASYYRQAVKDFMKTLFCIKRKKAKKEKNPAKLKTGNANLNASVVSTIIS
ncbi:unnamed protein product [Caenorhabditis nigoni]